MKVLYLTQNRNNKEMDHAHPGLETGHSAIHDSVRRTTRAVISSQLHKDIYDL